VLADFGEHTYDVNGTVDDTRTVFIINGSPPEVVDFLNRVAERLVSPPVERLELERDVLRSEYMQRPSTSQDGLRMARFGPRDYGLLPAEPIGLDWLGADDVIGWTRRSFVRQRAALWLSGPPPAGLSLSLPDGTWSAPPIPVAHAAAQLPMHVVGLPDGLVVGAMGKRSVGLNIGWQLAERALRRRLRHTEGVLYDIAGSYSPLTADIADMALGGECRGDRVGYVRDAIIEELTRLERDGPTTAEIETQVTLFRRQFEEPFAPLGVLDTIVTNLLFGRPYESPAEMLAEYSGAQPNDVAAAFADGVIASLVVIAPEDVPLAPGFQLDAASSGSTRSIAHHRGAPGRRAPALQADRRRDRRQRGIGALPRPAARGGRHPPGGRHRRSAAHRLQHDGPRRRPGASGSMEHVCRELARLPQASYVAMVTGSFDVFVEAICRDPEDFRTFLTEDLHAIDGVLGAESFIILELHKLAYGWGVASADSAPRLLGGGKPSQAGR
jgi:hypothetical protein